jgi:hypothetical protein
MAFSFSSLVPWWRATEADVVAIIGKIKDDAEIAVSDVEAALNWLAGEVPTIVAGLQTAVGLASAVGVVTAPELAAAQAAVVALQAFARVQSGGGGTLAGDAKAVVSGYVAYAQAQAAVAAAKSTAASAVSRAANP